MICLNKKHIQKEELLHEWFYQKYGSRALFNQDKINDLLRKELQQAVNDLLEAELTACLGYNPYARCKMQETAGIPAIRRNYQRDSWFDWKNVWQPLQPRSSIQYF